MQVKLETTAPGSAVADLLVVSVFAKENLADVLAGISKDNKESKENKDKGVSAGLLDALAATAHEEGFSGKSGQTLMLPTYGQAPYRRLFLVGMGTEKELTLAAYRKLGVAASKKLVALESAAADESKLEAKSEAKSDSKSSKKKSSKLGERVVSYALRVKNDIDPGHALEAVIEAWLLSAFTFVKYKTGKDAAKSGTARSFTNLTLNVHSSDFGKGPLKRASEKAIAMATATNVARELIAEPPSVMTPTRLAAEATHIAEEFDLSIKVLESKQVEKLGMGAFLGVARGAEEPLRFIVLKYTAAKAKKTIGLVGKGITFDSGGLSLKTAVGMEHMKYDMAGAAAVLGAMRVVGQLKPNVSVLAVVAATENMPGANALHPGDVLKSMNGKTIEVNNTDAEGRLILADAITYALREGADEIIDIATLTGAVVSALGRVAAGIMGSNQDLVTRVIDSGKPVGEQFWQLPLFVEYKDGLKSDIADLKNAGSRGEAGSSSAAMFLKEFTEDKPWAHLDIAGVAWLERERDELCKGGTGFGVRTLSNYVLSHE
jgi:leucyl aminopeptidase